MNTSRFGFYASVAAIAIFSFTSSLQAQVYIDTNETVPGTQSSPWNVSDKLYIGNTGTGSLSISNGGSVISTTSNIGYETGSTGTVVVTGAGSNWNIISAGTGVNDPNGTLLVGYYGDASLTISNGGIVSSAAAASIGMMSGSTGTVEVTGTGSSWDVAHLYVGFYGNASLTISDGATVNVLDTSAHNRIGMMSGSTGTVVVTGAGSSWNTTGGMDVGYSGNGSLTISDGATVSSNGSSIGKSDDSKGIVVVTGAGSSWNTTGGMYVGQSGNSNGYLIISNGATVTSANTTGYSTSSYIGNYATGAAVVTGAGSTWNIIGSTAYLYVGNFGNGTLTISDGGQVTSGMGVIGRYNQSTSNVVVTGTGSSWTSTAGLTVGSAGTGSLLISDGGTVSNTYSHIGSSGQGNVVVTGAGSTWINTGALSVGGSGKGTLTISDGGQVTNSQGATIGTQVRGEGLVEVTGAGSQWNNNGYLRVGENGTGSLVISDGGSVSNKSYSMIGYSSNSQGTAVVTGTGSHWNNNGYLRVGYSGTGSLFIADGGAVSNVQASIGYEVGSTGIVKVTGVGSSWNNIGTFDVGYSGNGTLTITDGGQVTSNQDANIGTQLTGEGFVEVTGAGSQWNNNGYLRVGENGTGSLVISDGGVVTGTVIIANRQSASGFLSIGAEAGGIPVAPGTINTPSVAFGAGNGTIVFNHTAVETDNYTFAPRISGNGTVNVLAGVTTFTGNNIYSGTTTVAGGTLKAGAASAFSPASDFVVESAGTLDLNGTSQTIASLANAGTVSLASSTSVGNTLTITGALAGNGGSFIMNTVLDGDASATDQIILDGGSASGASSLVINNQGGTGTKTKVGIMVVSAVNGATTSEDSFVLSPASSGYRSTTQSIVAGAYDYSLVRGGNGGDANSFYLTSFDSPVVPTPEPQPQPDPEPGTTPDKGNGSSPQPDISGGNKGSSAVPAIPTYRPEAGIYLSNQRVAQTMFMTTLRDREGYAQTVNGKQGNSYAGWGRATGNRSKGQAGSGSLNTQADVWMAQLGVDLLYLEGQHGTMHAGLMGGFGKADTKASSRMRSQYKADGSVDGYSVGVYGTWYQNEKDGTGLYADGWAQYGWYDNEVRGVGLTKEEYNSETFTASLEVGYGFELSHSDNWRIMFEPQAQVIYVNYSADRHIEQSGTVVRLKNDDGFITRVGGRLYGIYTYEDGSTLRPYMEANWWHHQKSGALLMNGDYVKGGAPKNLAEIKLGVQGEFARNWSVWGHASGQIGDRNYNAIGGQLGVKYTW
ncbi:autotransporter outer membrane beta-barrel domain-containing protein [Microvirga sp. W0021]|uniref:Autotransporter outer membrane beta-barrel domain-containing protein n=1 Tax=Hohaiivirga grylli TaxID=3133970 RepID=A0ABV0BM67_9HYPH